LGQLQRAAEAWLVFDLRPPAEGVAALTVEVGGRRLAGSSLVPTLPPLREFTLPDGPPRRQFAQWWGLPLDAALRAEANGGRLRVRLSVLPGRRAFVAGDRFAGQHSLYEGPSFGDWPNLAAIKFDYDGDSRLRVRRPLASSSTTSYVFGSDGIPHPISAVHRIRIVTLASSQAELRWRTAPAARAGATAFLFGAYSRFSAPDGVRGHADLLVGDRLALAFPLESRQAFRVSAGEAVLCHRPLPDRPGRARGAYALLVPVPEAGASLALTARFRSGLSAEEMLFRLDPRTSLDALAAELAGCLGNEPLVNGAAQVLDETRNRYPEDTGRFRVDAVY
jgi:hypothetical protein